MGRRTFDSLPGLLPGRRHIVLTRDRDWSARRGRGRALASTKRCELAGDEPVSVIGGAEIFELFLPLADRIELTEVLGDIAGDTVMADPRLTGDWREIAREEHRAEDGPRRSASSRWSAPSAFGRRPARVFAEALQLVGEHAVDQRRELVRAAVGEAGDLVIQRQLASRRRSARTGRPSRPPSLRRAEGPSEPVRTMRLPGST